MSKLKGQKNKYERFKKNVNTSRLDSAMVYMYDEKINSIIDELKSVKKKKQILKRANIADIDLENYVGILELMNSVDYNRTNDDNLDKLDEKINKISDEIKNVSGDEWFIVVGGDTTLPLAKFELAKAVAININSKIIKRQNSYRTVICGFKTKEDSELKLQEAKDKINVTSYIVKKSSWCKVLIEGKEYSTCE